QTYLSLRLMFGRNLDSTTAIEREVDVQAWKRLTSLKLAADLGLRTGDDEIVRAIQQDRQFSPQGSFDRARYKAFVGNVLRNMDADESLFEENVRQSLTLQKFQGMLASATWINPAELQRLVSAYADSFRIRYVLLGTNSLHAAPVITTDEALKFYNTHTNSFLIPDRVSVRYVAWPIKDAMTNTITESDVNYFYEENHDAFTSAGTNGEPVLKPLAEVAGTISNQLLRQQAALATRDKATDFTVGLTPPRDGSAAPGFEAYAGKAGLAVHTTGLFRATQELPGIKTARNAFQHEAFTRDDSPDNYYSDPIIGEDLVYVLALNKREAPRMPAFEEVREEVLTAARQAALEKAALEFAKSAQSRLASTVAQGQSFDASVKALGATLHTTDVFSAFTVPEELQDAEIVRALTQRNRGEVTDVIPFGQSYLIAYVAERTPATPETATSVHRQIISALTRRRSNTLFSGWQTWLIQQPGYQAPTGLLRSNKLISEEPADESVPATDSSADQ
ncbi:MAG: SurA N-terminal domain-containing protein, partial [Kiritimatiellia bacterium]